MMRIILKFARLSLDGTYFIPSQVSCSVPEQEAIVSRQCILNARASLPSFVRETGGIGRDETNRRLIDVKISLQISETYNVIF